MRGEKKEVRGKENEVRDDKFMYCKIADIFVRLVLVRGG